MKERLRNLEKKSKFFRGVFFIPKYALTWFKAKIVSDKRYILSQYKSVFGVDLNLKDPKTFTEKIQWLKLNDRNHLYTVCADKFKVRDFVKARIGDEYLIPLLYATNKPESIPFDKLPSEYIIKTNHTSGYNMICKDGMVHFFSRTYGFDKKNVVKILRKWLRKNVFYQNREWEYKNIPPKVIVEELLHDESNNDMLNDYKIHCFNGKPRFIQTLFDRSEGIKENWFDTEWSPIDLYYYSKERKQISKPDNLSELLEVAQKLSKEFNYVRVDLYSVNGKVLFGELTFHPYGGFMKFEPQIWNEKLGELLVIKS